ncbi:MerR family transcriptional regulator [Desulfovibrio mangrovi]|nr:MerR family transcriptional regulator [Desulfovibrio mangrovi]UZP68719.1 MerR family transcriptional regulator [Desulfovibrio mangrovi]
MVREAYSLREIGRRLDIPPSTISYYKDRFARYIPVAGGQGRRVKYPAEAVILFREIREMFTRNWSAEQVEEQLAAMQHVATGVTVEALSFRGDDSLKTKEFVHDLAGVLDKMSSVLEAQAHFRAEIDLLRDEVAQLRQEKVALISSYESKIAEMDEEIARFRKERADLMGRLINDCCTDGVRADMPDASVISRPLVVKSGGEFLGVAGKGKPFSLRDLIALLKRNAGSQKVQRMDWEQEDDVWRLRIETEDESGKGHEYHMNVAATVTPSKNAVTELREMTVDGEAVPDKFILMLFKTVKDGLER